jgi:ATP-dependent Zn protease
LLLYVDLNTARRFDPVEVRHSKEVADLTSSTRSRAKVYVETDTKVTFRDVAGVDEAKHELQEIVAFLRDPKSFVTKVVAQKC